MKKISVSVWAFVLLLVAFFTAGAFALGTVKHTGKSLACLENKTAYYTVDMANDELLAAVYLNIGEVYLPEGGEGNVYVKYSTSSTSTSNWKRVAPPVAVGHADSYNWLCFASGKDLKNIKRLSFYADCNLDLNEIVCLNASGEIIALSVGKNGTSGTDYDDEAVAKSIDNQEDFHRGTNAYYAYTQEEGRTLASVQNILKGTEVTEGSIYRLASGYNYLASLLTLPAVAVFGVSPFSLRITPFIALCVGVAFLYLIAKELLKKDVYALYFGAAGVVAAATVLRSAGATAYASSALLGAAYFALRFFTRGISSKRIVKGGLNVLFAGVFAAFALAIDTTAIFGVLGVLAILALGLVRQKTAFKLALQKAVESGAETDKIRYDHEYKTRVSLCFAALSFIVVTFALILLSAVVCYPAILRTYGSSTGFGTAMWLGVKAGWWNKGVGGRINLLKWTVGAGASVALRIACIGGLVAFAAATALVVVGFVQKTSDKKTLRVRRAYFLLLGALVTTALSWLVKGGVPAIPSALFMTAYLAFFPLAGAAARALKGGKK